MNCPKCEGPMWDNREKKNNPKAPDFKCKDTNCDGVIWPQKGKQQRARPTPGDFDKTYKSPPNGNDNRSKRIERQHSQHMAVLLVKARYPNGTPEGIDITKLVRDLTDWFQRDIGRSPEKVTREPELEPQSDPTDEVDHGDEPPF